MSRSSRSRGRAGRRISGRVPHAGALSAGLALAASASSIALIATTGTAAAAGQQATHHQLDTAKTVLSDLGPSVTIPDTTPVIKNAHWFSQGPAATTSASALVALQHNNQAGLLKLITQITTPGSAQYEHYLTSAQFNARFAPRASTVTAVETYLKSFGLTINSVPTNRAYVYVTGNVGEMARAFDTTIDSYMRDGVLYHAPTTALSIPAALQGEITGVTGLDSGDIATPFIESANQFVNPFAGASTATATAPKTVSVSHRTGHDAAGCITTAAATPTFTTQANPVDTPPDAAYVNEPPFSTSFDSCSATQAPGYGSSSTLGDAIQGYTPAQVEGAYGVSTAIADGLTGTGETVVVIDAYSSPTMVADADQWSKNMGLPAPNLTIDDTVADETQPDGPTVPTDVPVVGGAALLSPSGWFGEESLDVEAVHAMAPGAHIIEEAATGAENEFLEMAQNTAVEDDKAQEISNSYGGSGSGGDSTNTTSDGYWEEAATLGIGVEQSTGDDGDNTGGGATDADAGADDGPNSPYVTAVGGTSLAVGPTNNYEWETYWSEQTATLSNGAWGTLSYDGGGGGGVSEVYPQPAWQKNVVPASIANYWANNPNAQSGDTIPGRSVPDISMLADPNTGFYMGLTQDFTATEDDATLGTDAPNGTDEEAYDQYRIGGTSLSSPLFAGMMALADQANGKGLGFVNPAMYALESSDPSAFHDPDTTSPVPGVVRTNYVDGTGEAGTTAANTSTVLRLFDDLKGVVQALPGYDDSTGLGSPNGLTFLCALAPNSTILKSIPGAPCGTAATTTTTTTTTTPTTTTTTTTKPPTKKPVKKKPVKKACTAAKKLSFPQHPAKPVRETKAVIYVNGKKLKTITGHKITSLVIARPKATKFTLKIVSTLSSAEVVEHIYKYNGCKRTLTYKVLHKPV